MVKVPKIGHQIKEGMVRGVQVCQKRERRERMRKIAEDIITACKDDAAGRRGR
jgi:hypothetical protein